MSSVKIKHYTESLYYELLLTSKYMKMFGTQIFEQECIELSTEEFSTLDVIFCNPGICQRDLAKLILKDRANTGRTLDVLEEKGFITRTLVERNNRPIKQIEKTQYGKDYLTKLSKVLREHFNDFNSGISEEELKQISAALKKIRTHIAEIIKTQI